MGMTIERVCQAMQKSPFGLISLAVSCGCGLTYLTTVLIPALLQRVNLWWMLEDDHTRLIAVVGSAMAFLLALISFGLERPLWPGAASLCVLAITEAPVILVMPFWTLMLLGAWSPWAVVVYLAAFVAALVLIVRRVTTGEVAIEPILRDARCPLIAMFKRPLSLR